MIDFVGIIRNYISTGDFVLENIEQRINTLWVEGKLTDDERAQLLAIAAENAKDVFQVDVLAKIADLSQRVYLLEHPVDQFVIWTAGYQTNQHEIVRYDVTGDGELDLCQYNGGRSYTGLSIGKIEGWNLLDRELNIVATITRDADGGYVITPVEPEPTPDEPEPATDEPTVEPNEG